MYIYRHLPPLYLEPPLPQQAKRYSSTRRLQLSLKLNNAGRKPRIHRLLPVRLHLCVGTAHLAPDRSFELERWHLSLHLLDRSFLSRLVRQFNRVGWEYRELDTRVVRYL